MPTTQPAESGVTRCPCCGDDFMTSDIHAGTPCDDCQDAGCELTRDGTGELGYWDCQREDVSDDPANTTDERSTSAALPTVTRRAATSTCVT